MGHAVRGAATAALALIALETIGTDRSGKVGAFFGDVNRLLARALSPDVPLIPDRRTGGGAAGAQLGYITPAQAAAAAAAAAALPGVGAVTGPGGALAGAPSLGQYVAGGGLAGIQNNPALHPAG